MTLLQAEIEEQPAVARRLLDATWPRLEELRGALLESEPDGIVVVARGSSDNAGRYAQYLWGLRLGIPVTMAAPSLGTVYRRPPDLRGHAVVAVSQSGSSPDVVGLVAHARAHGRPTLALTNHPGSPLAEAAEHVLDLSAGPERSVAATKTYTASLLALAMIALALQDGDPAEDAEALGRVPAALRAAVHGARGVHEAARLLGRYDRAVCVGRGLNLATAHEVALKLTELSGMLVAPYSPADLMHGPVAAVGPETPAILVVPDEPASASVLEILPELRRRGAPVVLLGGGEGGTEHQPPPAPDPEPVARVTLPTDAAVPGWLSPVTSVVAGQLLAWRLAEARGVDVDRPGELTKVTRTR